MTKFELAEEYVKKLDSNGPGIDQPDLLRFGFIAGFNKAQEIASRKTEIGELKSLILNLKYEEQITLTTGDGTIIHLTRIPSKNKSARHDAILFKAPTSVQISRAKEVKDETK